MFVNHDEITGMAAPSANNDCLLISLVTPVNRLHAGSYLSENRFQKILSFQNLKFPTGKCDPKTQRRQSSGVWSRSW